MRPGESDTPADLEFGYRNTGHGSEVIESLVCIFEAARLLSHGVTKGTDSPVEIDLDQELVAGWKHGSCDVHPRFRQLRSAVNRTATGREASNLPLSTSRADHVTTFRSKWSR
jgi:hypothetical protein